MKKVHEVPRYVYKNETPKVSNYQSFFFVVGTILNNTYVIHTISSLFQKDVDFGALLLTTK